MPNLVGKCVHDVQRYKLLTTRCSVLYMRSADTKLWRKYGNTHIHIHIHIHILVHIDMNFYLLCVTISVVLMLITVESRVLFCIRLLCTLYTNTYSYSCEFIQFHYAALFRQLVQSTWHLNIFLLCLVCVCVLRLYWLWELNGCAYMWYLRSEHNFNVNYSFPLSFYSPFIDWMYLRRVFVCLFVCLPLLCTRIHGLSS